MPSYQFPKKYTIVLQCPRLQHLCTYSLVLRILKAINLAFLPYIVNRSDMLTSQWDGDAIDRDS